MIVNNKEENFKDLKSLLKLFINIYVEKMRLKENHTHGLSADLALATHSSLLA